MKDVLILTLSSHCKRRLGMGRLAYSFNTFLLSIY